MMTKEMYLLRDPPIFFQSRTKLEVVYHEKLKSVQKPQFISLLRRKTIVMSLEMYTYKRTDTIVYS